MKLRKIFKNEISSFIKNIEKEVFINSLLASEDVNNVNNVRIPFGQFGNER